MKTPITLTCLVLLVTTLLAGCKKKDDPVAPTPPAVNEEEVITTLVITFTDQENSSEVFELRYADVDGVGGNPPVATGDALPNNRAFHVALQVLNESASPAIDLTGEISAEGAEHQFFFQGVGAYPVISYADTDSNGRPIGLTNIGFTTASGTGTLTVILRHMPDKNGTDVATGDITNAGGETDLVATIPITVQ